MKTIRKGSRGPAVRTCQERLNANGFDAGTADGIFGSRTDKAVRFYQSAHNLDVDGIVGPSTWSLLMSGPNVPDEEDALQEEREELLRQIGACANPQARRVVEEAIRWLGTQEVPDGSNTGPDLVNIVGKYPAYWHIRPAKHHAWCGMFVSDMIRRGLGLGEWEAEGAWPPAELPGHPLGKFLGGVGQLMDWGIENGTYVLASESRRVAAGEIVIMSREHSGSDPSSSANAGHTGLVICDQGDTVITIEGNTSNSVKSLVRKKSGLMGFVRWWDV